MSIKKISYILLTIVLCLLFSMIIHSLLEITVIKYYLSKGIIPDSYSSLNCASCALPYYVQAGLVIFGIVGGYFLGQYWWRIIYVEKRYGKIK